MKHQSAWDTLAALGDLFDDPAIVLKRELLLDPALRLVPARKAGMIAIDRGAGASALRAHGGAAPSASRQGAADRDLPRGHAHAGRRAGALSARRRALCRVT